MKIKRLRLRFALWLLKFPRFQWFALALMTDEEILELHRLSVQEIYKNK